MQRSPPRFAVVGHVEWVQFARVPHIPRSGEIVHARDEFEEPAGGGAVAAVQLARLDGRALLLTALGGDELGRRSVARLEELGVEVRAVTRTGAATRRALTLVDDRGERTITTLGERLEPFGADPLPWEELAQMDGVFFTAGDRAALEMARAANVLVANPRAGNALGHGVPLDALVLSNNDAIEREAADIAREETELLVLTDGERGGRWQKRAGAGGHWQAAVPPAALQDSYGCGDSFHAGLTYGLASGMDTEEAVALAARCGAWCLAGRGPYEGQLA